MTFAGNDTLVVGGYGKSHSLQCFSLVYASRLLYLMWILCGVYCHGVSEVDVKSEKKKQTNKQQQQNPFQFNMF